MELCEMQKQSGLYFLFEHPPGASSWNMASVQRMLKKPRANAFEGGARQYDMTQTVKGGRAVREEVHKFHGQ